MQLRRVAESIQLHFCAATKNVPPKPILKRITAHFSMSTFISFNFLNFFCLIQNVCRKWFTQSSNPAPPAQEGRRNEFYSSMYCIGKYQIEISTLGANQLMYNLTTMALSNWRGSRAVLKGALGFLLNCFLQAIFVSQNSQICQAPHFCVTHTSDRRTNCRLLHASKKANLSCIMYIIYIYIELIMALFNVLCVGQQLNCARMTQPASCGCLCYTTTSVRLKSRLTKCESVSGLTQITRIASRSTKS